MSNSKRRAARPRRSATIVSPASGTEEFRLPATVSRPALLERGSDRRFRQMVYDLLTISSRMNIVREHLGRRMGVSAPQYSVLMTIGQFQGRHGVGVAALAKVLHVSSAFIATETGKLAQLGLVAKRSNPNDGRAVLLSLTRAGEALIESNSAEIHMINDVFFGALDAKAFAATSAAIAALVHSSHKAVWRLGDPSGVRRSEAAE